VADQLERKPSVSVVVILYHMQREAPRTLYSLSAAYQRYIKSDDYEVVVVDNGSNPPFDPGEIDSLPGNFRLIRIDPASPSPAKAINRGLAEARGDVIGVMVDGARIATPGLLHFALHGAHLHDKAVVATLGWYLGYDFQRLSMQGGHDHAYEDALLKSIDWPVDGYRLFEISTMDESSVDGWFQPIAESNALFLRRELWDLLGGVDERFDAPGGGLINLDTFHRALELADSELVIPLGEATFHQLHGGVSNNALPEIQAANLTSWLRQYEAIRGRPWDLLLPKNPPTYIGTLPSPALARMVRAAVYPSLRFVNRPLGKDFDEELWTCSNQERAADTTIAELVELAQNEFRDGRFEAACAVSRLIRERAPDEREPQRLLALVSAYLYPGDVPPESQRGGYHLALGHAHRILGEYEAAALNYREALGFDQNLRAAQVGLDALRAAEGD
jgi:Glycosyl transferase family 2